MTSPERAADANGNGIPDSQEKEVASKKRALTSEWHKRRRMIFASLFFCAFWVSYIIVVDSSSSIIHQTALYVLSGFAVTLATAYIGGSVIDDKNVMSNVTALMNKGG
jgi:hypothetical protein